MPKCLRKQDGDHREEVKQPVTIKNQWLPLSAAVKRGGSGVRDMGSDPDSATMGCVTLGKSLNLPVPQFPQL